MKSGLAGGDHAVGVCAFRLILYAPTPQDGLRVGGALPCGSGIFHVSWMRIGHRWRPVPEVGRLLRQAVDSAVQLNDHHAFVLEHARVGTTEMAAKSFVVVQ